MWTKGSQKRNKPEKSKAHQGDSVLDSTVAIFAIARMIIPELLSIRMSRVRPNIAREETYSAVFAALKAEYMKHDVMIPGKTSIWALITAMIGAECVRKACKTSVSLPLLSCVLLVTTVGDIPPPVKAAKPWL